MMHHRRRSSAPILESGVNTLAFASGDCHLRLSSDAEDVLFVGSCAARKREQNKRWFRNGQKWRTGCEGRISVAKRRHGLNRCRNKADRGIKRWVGIGVIADTLINIGRAMAQAAA
jgi:hypothetical protein